MSISSPDKGRAISNLKVSHLLGKRAVVWLLPVGLLLGFLFIFALLFRDRLLPAKSVEIYRATGIEEKTESSPLAKTKQAIGGLLFQASGWVEPDPLPIKATALTDGIVDEVHVLEGELVKKGDLLASLIGIDRRLERDAKLAKLADVKAYFDAHCVGTQIAMQQMDIEKANLSISEANAEEAAEKLLRYERASKGSISQDEMLKRRLDSKRSLAEVAAAKARVILIAEELNKIAYEVLAIQSRIKSAEIDLEKAELAYSRTRILSPIDGRVLALKAAPGQKKMVGMDEEDSATVAVLYQPDHLQVRVDVPLADAAGLSVGQRAKIRCNLLPDQIFEGEVTRIEGSADLQRNTLQAKVRIENPSEQLRPEMLCRVEFFETRNSSSEAISNSAEVAVYIPLSAIENGYVWICDPESLRAEKREVSVSGTKDGMARVSPLVRPGEWVIAKFTELKSGQRLKPISKN